MFDKSAVYLNPKKNLLSPSIAITSHEDRSIRLPSKPAEHAPDAAYVLAGACILAGVAIQCSKVRRELDEWHSSTTSKEESKHILGAFTWSGAAYLCYSAVFKGFAPLALTVGFMAARITRLMLGEWREKRQQEGNHLSLKNRSPSSTSVYNPLSSSEEVIEVPYKVISSSPSKYPVSKKR